MAPAHDIPAKPRPGARRRSGFVLIEVLMAMTILGLASMAFLKSFTYSLGAARKMEIMTQAGFFATQLLDEFEIFPPEEGITEGGFGEDYKNYSYRAEVKYVDPEYRNVDPPDDVLQFFAERQLHLEIFYDDGVRQPYTAVELDGMIMGFEKFSTASKLSYLNF